MTTKETTTIRLLKKGWVTALKSAQAGGYLSLSQRVGGWKREGAKIIDRWVTTSGGSRVKEYRWVK